MHKLETSELYISEKIDTVKMVKMDGFHHFD